MNPIFDFGLLGTMRRLQKFGAKSRVGAPTTKSSSAASTSDFSIMPQMNFSSNPVANKVANSVAEQVVTTGLLGPLAPAYQAGKAVAQLGKAVYDVAGKVLLPYAKDAKPVEKSPYDPKPKFSL